MQRHTNNSPPIQTWKPHVEGRIQIYDKHEYLLIVKLYCYRYYLCEPRVKYLFVMTIFQPGPE